MTEEKDEVEETVRKVMDESKAFGVIGITEEGDPMVITGGDGVPGGEEYIGSMEMLSLAAMASDLDDLFRAMAKQDGGGNVQQREDKKIGFQ